MAMRIQSVADRIRSPEEVQHEATFYFNVAAVHERIPLCPTIITAARQQLQNALTSNIAYLIDFLWVPPGTALQGVTRLGRCAS